MCDNKKFWEVVKPFLSNKSISSEKKALVEGTRILKNDKETAKVLSIFFSSIIQNIKIPQYKQQDPISASISDPVMRALLLLRKTAIRVHVSIFHL